ncbi:hypothetical protein PSCICN_09290 [Pseudomonas cichorii]|nr:hypothetical protein PSCICN_09290 [Pseudomonas cichorii]
MTAQVMSQTVGPLIERLIAQALIARHQCNRIRRTFDLSLEQAMNGLIERIWNLSGIEAGNHLVPLLGRQDFQCMQRQAGR